MGDKAKLIQDAQEAYEELAQAIAGLSESDASRVWLGTWGARDILIHIAGWNREMALALTRIRKGEPAYPEGQYDDADAWNARFVQARQGATLSQILDEVASAHRELLTAASALTDAQLASEAPARAIFEGTAAQHYREHGAQIRQWRAGAP